LTILVWSSKTAKKEKKIEIDIGIESKKNARDNFFGKYPTVSNPNDANLDNLNTEVESFFDP